MESHERLFVALDTTDVERAAGLAQSLAGHVGGIKLGKEFFTAHGPQGVRRVAACGLPLFLDLKFHDIPNTVAGAVRAVLPLAPAMVNVHATGGAAMMRAAAEAAQEAGPERPLVLGVTVLTSLSEADLNAVGIAGPLAERVVALARLAKDSGLDGVVCPGREAAAVRRACGADFKLVVPGIRPPSTLGGDDQKRTMTPAEAVAAGADVLVVGRPITGAADPIAAVRAIAGEIDAG